MTFIRPAGNTSSPLSWSSSGTWVSGGNATWSAGPADPVTGNSGGVVTIGRTGYYIVRVWWHVPRIDGWEGVGSLFINGSLVSQVGLGQNRDNPATDCLAWWEGVLSVGGTISAQQSENQAGDPTPHIEVMFVPTPTYPH